MSAERPPGIHNRADQHLGVVGRVVATLNWICDQMNQQLRFEGAQFGQFEYLVAKSLLEAAELHVLVVSRIRAITSLTVMNRSQREKLRKLMEEVADYEEDIIVPEAILRIRVREFPSISF